MKESLRKYCQALIAFSDQEFEVFLSCFSIRSLAKKEYFIQEGHYCREIAFINQGIFRHFHVKDGVELTCDISTENTFITDYVSFNRNILSSIALQALEPSELLVIKKDQLFKLYRLNPKYESLGRKIAENVAIRNTEIAMSLASDKPEKRYQNFLEKNPNIFNRVPQKYIANILGLTPESLSRIRKRIYQHSKS